jgi:hypothetical protein
MINGYLGLLVFGGVLFAGYKVRMLVKEKQNPNTPICLFK